MHVKDCKQKVYDFIRNNNIVVIKDDPKKKFNPTIKVFTVVLSDNR